MKSDGIRLNQLESNEIKWDQMESNEITWNQIGMLSINDDLQVILDHYGKAAHASVDPRCKQHHELKPYKTKKLAGDKLYTCNECKCEQPLARKRSPRPAPTPA